MSEDTVTVSSRKYGPRVFTRVGIGPSFTRRDGIVAYADAWRSACVVCGGPFDIVSAVRSGGQFEIVTCPTHRGRLRPVALSLVCPAF